MKKILVPLDGSALSRDSLKYVLDFFDPEVYSVTLLQVAALPPGFTTPLSAVMLDAWVSNGIHSLDEAVESYADSSLHSFRAAIFRELAVDMQQLHKADFKVTVAVEFGNPAAQISRFAKDNNYDLIVMATHGRKGIERSLLGSVSESVVKQLHIPVLLVKPERIAA